MLLFDTFRPAIVLYFLYLPADGEHPLAATLVKPLYEALMRSADDPEMSRCVIDALPMQATPPNIDKLRKFSDCTCVNVRINCVSPMHPCTLMLFNEEADIKARDKFG